MPSMLLTGFPALLTFFHTPAACAAGSPSRPLEVLRMPLDPIADRLSRSVLRGSVECCTAVRTVWELDLLHKTAEIQKLSKMGQF